MKLYLLQEYISPCFVVRGVFSTYEKAKERGVKLKGGLGFRITEIEVDK